VKTQFLVLDWGEFVRMSIELAHKITASGVVPHVILAILRGGYFIAKLLSDYLGIENLATIEIKFYKGIGERAERPVVVQPITMDLRDRVVMVVDDVADSGRTLQVAADMARLRGAKEVYTAALFYKPWSIIMPDFFVSKTDKWIVFPWEIGETLRELRREYGDLREAAKHLGIDRVFGEDYTNKLIEIIESSDALRIRSKT